MDTRTLGITIGIAAIAIVMGCLTAVALMEGPSGDGVDTFEKDGLTVTGTVGTEMDALVCNDIVVAINEGVVDGYTITSDNLPDGLGLEFYLHYNGSADAQDRFELRVSGTPAFATGDGSEWDGHYVVELASDTSAYIVEGQLDIGMAE